MEPETWTTVYFVKHDGTKVVAFEATPLYEGRAVAVRRQGLTKKGEPYTPQSKVPSQFERDFGTTPLEAIQKAEARTRGYLAWLQREHAAARASLARVEQLAVDMLKNA